MSRYILVPIAISKGEEESFPLMPVEGFNKQLRQIHIPKDLVLHKDMYSKAGRKKRLHKLFQQLSKADIGCNEMGEVYYKNGVLNGINFNDAVIKSCNGVFIDDYEDFYCLLRENGITF